MGTFLFNGIEFMVDYYPGWLNEAFEKKGIEYNQEEIPVKFLTRPFVKYFLSIYTYESIKEKGKTVYCVAIEVGNEEGGGTTIFQSYEKIDAKIAAELEDAYYNRKLNLSDELKNFLYC